MSHTICVFVGAVDALHPLQKLLQKSLGGFAVNRSCSGRICQSLPFDCESKNSTSAPLVQLLNETQTFELVHEDGCGPGTQHESVFGSFNIKIREHVSPQKFADLERRISRDEFVGNDSHLCLL